MTNQLGNDELLRELQVRLQTGELDPQEVQTLLQAPENPTDGDPTNQTASHAGAQIVTRLLYIIGGIFITLGLLYFVSQIWDDLNGTSRIMISLGLGISFAGAGSLFMVRVPERELGSVFHAIGGFMVPGGALVTLDEMGVALDDNWPVTLTIGMVFAFYLLLTLYHRRVVLNFFAFLNGTAFAYLLTDSLLPDADGAIFDYLTMCLGASYLLYAHLLRDGWNDRLIPLLLFFGTFGFYGAAFSQIRDTLMMEILYPFLAFGGLVLAASVVKSRIMLVLCAFAIIAYIAWFTAEYFADSLGWPISLILLGFVIIGIGYLSISLNRRYLKPELHASTT